MSLLDLTKRGLEAHLQKVVLDLVVEEQLDAFEMRLRESLEEKVRSITIGHVEHVSDVMKLGEQLFVRIDVNMQHVNGASA